VNVERLKRVGIYVAAAVVNLLLVLGITSVVH
jgi:hypothetical protein